MFTVDSHIHRLAGASINPVGRNQSLQALTIDPVAADEFFAGYRDEVSDDEPVDIFRSDSVRVAVSGRESTSAVRYQFDDILRLAVPAQEYAPLG